MSVCKRVFSVGFGPGLDSMSPARSWRSAIHAAGSHDWLPKKNWEPGLQGGIYNLQSSPPTAAHQPRAGCIRMVPIEYITALFNLSVTTCHILAIWKSSLIIPIPKPGKDTSLGISYQPISLLCPVAKLPDSFILPTINFSNLL